MHRAIVSMRWVATLIFVGSAVQVAIFPRADHPLIDFAELMVPGLRALYFTSHEAETYSDAKEHAERYRLEAEALNTREKYSRTEGQPLDDFAVARMSSFLKSYGEMRKGEEFVMSEVRLRARSRVRWIVSAAMLLIAILLAPVSWSALRWKPATRL